MQLRAEQFQASLEGSLPAAIVLCASEPLLLVEARQALRAAAARQGFVERESFDIGVDASFEDFRLAAQSLGLFARQRMFDVRMSGSKLDHEGAAILKEYLEFPDPHAVLLISVPELSNAVLKLAWLKNFEAAGWVVPLWAPKAAEVPAWIKRRASQLGVQLTADAVSFLSERIEGNLLAAQQELSMLSLLAEGRALDAKALRQIVADGARFDVYRLSEAMLLGDAARVVRVLRGLRGEGQEPVAIFSWLMYQVEQTTRLSERVAAGTPLAMACQSEGIAEWNRQPFFKAVSRGDYRQWLQRLQEAALVDRTLKGRGHQPPWFCLERWALRCAGVADLAWQ